MQLNGKIALVTGSSRGIGKAIAIAIMKAGGTVIVTYKINKNLADEVTKKDKTGESIVVQMDVSNRLSVKKAKKDIIDKFKSIDILVNNAGINRPNDFDRISDEEWDEVLGVNLKGAFVTTQEFLPFIKKGGSIINISSVSGQYGGPRTAHYAASKAGLISLGQVIARFGARYNIRCNTIAVGLITSEMATKGMNSDVVKKTAANILIGRLGTTDEVAKVVVFLASNDSSYITAQTINVNGGLYF